MVSKAENQAKIVKFLSEKSQFEGIEMCEFAMSNPELFVELSSQLGVNTEGVQFLFKGIQEKAYAALLRTEYLNIRYEIINYLFENNLLLKAYDLSSEQQTVLLQDMYSKFAIIPQFIIKNKTLSILKQVKSNSEKRSLLGVVLNQFGVITSCQELDIKTYQQKLGLILDKIRVMEGQGIKKKNKPTDVQTTEMKRK